MQGRTVCSIRRNDTIDSSAWHDYPSTFNHECILTVPIRTKVPSYCGASVLSRENSFPWNGLRHLGDSGNGGKTLESSSVWPRHKNQKEKHIQLNTFHNMNLAEDSLQHITYIPPIEFKNSDWLYPKWSAKSDQQYVWCFLPIHMIGQKWYYKNKEGAVEWKQR